MLHALVLGLLGAPAIAGGSASPAPPPPPSVDFAGLPATADVHAKGADGKEHPVHARLVAEDTAFAAGSTVRVGVHLDQADGWHTYWRSPGDIGLPTDITWTLPPGLTASPHAFPVPQRFELDGLVSYGYDDQVLLISNLTIPADTKPGDYQIAAKASWLVCQSSCIPGGADLSLPIHVVAAGTPTEKTPWAPLFDHYAAQHPVPEAGSGLRHSLVLSQSAIRPNDKFDAAFVFEADGGLTPPTGAGTWPTFTVITGPDWMLSVEKPTEIRAIDGKIAVIVHGEALVPDPLPPSEPIGGLVQVQLGGKWVRTEVVEALPFAAEGSPVTPSADPLWKQLGSSAAPPAAEKEPAVAQVAAPAPAQAAGGLVWNLLLAFVGGLILNIMPCVLPVLMLKLYSLIEQAEITPRERHTSAIAYSAGILVSFLALAAAIIGARLMLGVDLGWGSQFQYPPYVAALATVTFAFGLSLFGVFEVPTFGAATASDAAAKEGMVGYFFTGVFATLLATPCSAPLLGTAVAFAFSAPTVELLAIFTSIAAGLAAPFLLIAFVPALYKLMPRPGEWMDWFKQLLGFSLIATTIWLVDVLGAQIGHDRSTWFLVFLLAVGVSSWVYGRWGGVLSDQRQHAIALATALGISGASGWFFLDLQIAEAAVCDTTVTADGLAFDEEIPWQPFSPAAVESLAGKPVFIDFTADWCLTCKVNERTVIDTSSVRAAMAEKGVVPLKADWTLRDPAITEWLTRYGKAGVPFYLVIPADRAQAPIPLPEVITADMVITALGQAAGR